MTQLIPDERAASEVLGAILVFALVIAVLVLVQALAVPAWNQQTEYEHNQRVQGDVAELSGAIDRVAAGSPTQTVRMELGTAYPVRPFLLNPPSPEGRLNTTGGSLTLSNVVATDAETADYWDYGPDGRTVESKTVAYRPNYRQYRNAPTTLYQFGTTYNVFADAELVTNDRQLVTGNDIDLTVVDGNYSASDTGPTAVDVSAASAPTETISVTGRNGEDVELTFTSRLPAAAWAEGEVTNPDVLSVTQSAPREVTMTLDGSETYDLRVARVSLGETAAPARAAYLVESGDAATVLPNGGLQTVRVQSRDGFNAPESDTANPVSWSVTGPGTLVNTSGPTPDGVWTATVRGTADTGTVRVTASGDLDGDGTTTDAERVTHAMSATTGPDSTGGGDGDDGRADEPDINPRREGSVYLSRVTYVQGSGNAYFRAEFVNGGNEARTWASGRIAFYSTQFGPGNRRAQWVDYARSSSGTPAARMSIGGEFVEFGSGVETEFQPGETRTVRFDPGRYRDNGQEDNGFTMYDGDFMVFNVAYADGATNTYFLGANDRQG